MNVHNDPSSEPSADILSEKQVAVRYQVPPSTVKRWRRTRTGPAFFRAGRYVRYRLSDLLAWEEREAARSAPQASPETAR